MGYGIYHASFDGAFLSFEKRQSNENEQVVFS